MVDVFNRLLKSRCHFAESLFCKRTLYGKNAFFVFWFQQVSQTKLSLSVFSHQHRYHNAVNPYNFLFHCKKPPNKVTYKTSSDPRLYWNHQSDTLSLAATFQIFCLFLTSEKLLNAIFD